MHITHFFTYYVENKVEIADLNFFIWKKPEKQPDFACLRKNGEFTAASKKHLQAIFRRFAEYLSKAKSRHLSYHFQIFDN